MREEYENPNEDSNSETSFPLLTVSLPLPKLLGFWLSIWEQSILRILVHEVSARSCATETTAESMTHPVNTFVPSS